MRYAEKTHNLSAPDASALVSVVSERAASDRDCARYSRSRAVPELATQLVEGLHTYTGDCGYLSKWLQDFLQL